MKMTGQEDYQQQDSSGVVMVRQNRVNTPEGWLYHLAELCMTRLDEPEILLVSKFLESSSHTRRWHLLNANSSMLHHRIHACNSKCLTVR